MRTTLFVLAIALASTLVGCSGSLPHQARVNNVSGVLIKCVYVEHREVCLVAEEHGVQTVQDPLVSTVLQIERDVPDGQLGWADLRSYGFNRDTITVHLPKVSAIVGGDPGGKGSSRADYVD